MAEKLLIVESPTKAKTIGKFLDKKYQVLSSFGHIRDLPKSKLGIDTEDNYKPQYVIPVKARKTVNQLKKSIGKNTEVYLATDEDREGEAIAWHLAQILKLPADKSKRIAFHEITATAVKEAISKPREMDINLVHSQQARRILDRLVGYKLSPWLWRKVAKGLSAGRVQSVAVRLIVEREKEIAAFKAQEYWSVEASCQHDDDIFTAKLQQIQGKKLDKFAINNNQEADDIVSAAKKLTYAITEFTSKEEKRNAPSPLTTSLLQQEANRRLGFSSKQTMMLAQQLYEGVEMGAKQAEGLITYMRTDSQSLSEKFLTEARSYIKENFGAEKLPSKAIHYRTKSKNAQEAHEAIRPTSAYRSPVEIKEYLNNNQYKLYKLIWERTLATQMKPAIISITTVNISDAKHTYDFVASGSVIKEPGYLTIYKNYHPENPLPPLPEKAAVNMNDIVGNQHFTKPPARYSDAGLVKQLEKRGIGRPSTYAPIISTIIERNYVQREEKRLQPTEIGILVADLLVEHFPKIMDYEFTAKLENDLDAIAQGDKTWVPVIDNFYQPFAANLNNKYESVTKEDIATTTEEICDKCGSPMVIKFARYGKFLACSNFPECKNTKNLDKNDNPVEPPKTKEKCPECGHDLQIKRGRFGEFLACTNYPDCKFTKSMEEDLDISCPRCEKGKIVGKRSRRGKLFYGCNRYPECDFALWQKPTGDKCPQCESLLVTNKKGEIFCSNKECDYKAATS
ncbi:MAG: type I DNA topoisomerase [Candidatus Komeilibacteria bacterium]